MKYITILIQILLNALLIFGFRANIYSISKTIAQKCQNNGCNERIIYRNYLLGLRQTRKILRNTTNINKLTSILNFTNDFMINNSYMLSPSQTILNNTEIGAKNIIMGNIILDVSQVRKIYIKTEKDILYVELDKLDRPNNIISINNLETILSTLSVMGKILNI
jgi:hypothetical protein